MKHWDGRDRDHVAELRLAQPDRQRIRDLFLETPKPKRKAPQIHSVIGLALAVGLLVGLAMLLAPSHPVSPKLMN